MAEISARRVGYGLRSEGVVHALLWHILHLCVLNVICTYCTFNRKVRVDELDHSHCWISGLINYRPILNITGGVRTPISRTSRNDVSRYTYLGLTRHPCPVQALGDSTLPCATIFAEAFRSHGSRGRALKFNPQAPRVLSPQLMSCLAPLSPSSGLAGLVLFWPNTSPSLIKSDTTQTNGKRNSASRFSYNFDS